MEILVAEMHLVICSVLVVYLGSFLTRNTHFLQSNNIPPAVTGGLIASSIVAAIYYFFDIKIEFAITNKLPNGGFQNL